MMHLAAPTSETSAPAQPALVPAEAQVAVVLDDGACLLDDGRLARQAASCLLSPEAGDLVLTIASKTGEHYILHLLKRSRDDEAELHVPNVQRLTVRQAQIG